MRKVFISFSVLFAVYCSYSQQLSQVSFANASDLSYFSFSTDQNILIRISAEGKVLEWGTEVLSDRYNYYAPRLQPFMGRVDYYGPESDSVFRGKVKSIGTCFLTYYGDYETAAKAGKLKSVGSMMLDYFPDYHYEKTIVGRLKQIGTYSLDYYGSFENEAFRGKLKSIGNDPITYYSVFNDKLNAGKIKSIGPVTYTWYSTHDRSEYRGGLKTGNYRQIINGITFILR